LQGGQEVEEEETKTWMNNNNNTKQKRCYAACEKQKYNFQLTLQWLLEEQKQQHHQQHQQQQQQQEKESLNGEVHVDEMNKMTELFFSISYKRQREHDCLDYIRSNGYILLNSIHDNKRQMINMIIETFPDALVIKKKKDSNRDDGDNDGVIILDTMINDVKVGIEEYSLQTSSSTTSKEEFDIFNLEEYISVDLIEPYIVHGLLDHIGLKDSSDHVVVVNNDHQAIVEAKVLVQRIKDKHLQRLIEEFAKSRAREMIEAANNSKEGGDEESDDDDIATTCRGGKSKSKRPESPRSRKGRQVSKQRMLLLE
jgi:hypothetical protein